MQRTEIKIGIIVIVAIISLWLVGNTLGIVKVEGNEAVVKQHLMKGVVEDVWLSGTKFYFGWLWDVYKYDIGTQKTTFDDKKANADAEYGRIIVDCGEKGGQKAYVAMSINYRIGWDADNVGSPVFSPPKLVKIHKDGIGRTYESVIIKRTVVDVVNKIARPHQALEIYSGQGFVDFKERVDTELRNHPVFKQRGIFIENTIIYKVYLDPAYEKEIAAKVLAIQTKLRKTEETKAAEEEAKRAFAEAQASVETRRQEAEAKKIEQVKQAEAEKLKRILEAEGERDANIAKADGILARGKAEAEIDALKREALYGGQSGSWRAKVHIAEKRAEKLAGMFNGVQIVPEKTILRAGEKGGMLTGINVDE